MKISGRRNKSRLVARLRTAWSSSYNLLFSLPKWCCRGGLNSRPLPYQGSALPLSYDSRRANVIENRPRWALKGAPVLAIRPKLAQARLSHGKPPKCRQNAMRCRPVEFGADPVPQRPLAVHARFSGAMQAGRNLPQPRNDASCQSPVAAVAPMRAFRASSAPVKSLPVKNLKMMPS